VTKTNQIRRAATVALVTLSLVLAWSFMIRLGWLSETTLPSPESVLGRLYEMLGSERFWYNASVTGGEAALGFVLGCGFAILLGMAVSMSRLVQRVLSPYLVGLQMVPKVAIAPLFVFWFGFGMTSKVLVAALICFLPMFLNVLQGMNSVSSEQVEMLRSAGASRFQLLRRLQVPAMLPLLFAALQICVVLAIIGAVVGEYVGAQAGLGYQILQYNASLRLAEEFAVLIVLAGVGVGFYTLAGWLRNRLVFW
jgi:NitT/TauT family transport system permease protein